MKSAFKIITSAAFLLLVFSSISLADSRDWSLVDSKGETFNLSDAKGDAPTMLIFWATWCAPCKKELSENRKLFESFSEQGMRVLLVAEDNAKTQAKVKPYIESKGYKWRVLLDTNGEVLKRYGGTSIPYTVMLDKDGKAVEKFRGEARDKEALSQKVKALLGGKSE